MPQPTSITYVNRETGKKEVEKVYGHATLAFLYGYTRIGRLLGKILLPLTTKLSWFSSLYGWWARHPATRKHAYKFIRKFNVPLEDYEEPQNGYKSFDDFFIRHLKANSRKMPQNPHAAIIPADGRYRFFPNIDAADTFFVKGQRLNLAALLQSQELADTYAQGTLVFGRLCPTDYHRFHFPLAGFAGPPHLINGPLYSVNPLALRKNIAILTENKRVITHLDTPTFGKVLLLEIGATAVGTIHQTFSPQSHIERGQEKGYFSFGGSAILLLFQKDTLTLENDLIGSHPLEILCKMGQPLGTPKAGPHA